MPNFKKLSKAYEQNALEALTEFVKRDSVYDPTTISEGAPYGKGVKSALDYIASLGKEYGFEVDTCDGRATELSFGDDDGTLVGIYAHADVVPASGKWDVPPFSGKVVGEGKEKKMISRGSSDDKGPLIAALYACKLLKDNGLVKGFKIRLVAGGDEERGSSCLEYYFHNLKKKPSDYGFTPDSEFPLIYGEKGIVHGYLKRNIDLSPIINIDGGVVSNAVCDRLCLTLPSDKEFLSYFKSNGFEGDVNEMGKIMMVTFKGKSAHGSTPEKGVNAAGIAFKAIGDFYHNAFLSKLSLLIQDANGQTFNGYSLSKELGPSTFNYGIVKYDGKALTVTVDYRFGEEANPEEAIVALKKGAEMDFVQTSKAEVLLFDKKSPLVSTLMKSYKRMTHRFFDKPLAIGGGTYAKEAPNCVAYGSAFKNHPGDIHSPNEYIYLDDLYAQIAIYADAIYSLGHLSK